MQERCSKLDERERQRRSRERRRSGESPASVAWCRWPGEAGRSRACHAPALADKSAAAKEKVPETWDRLVAVSRASLDTSFDLAEATGKLLSRGDRLQGDEDLS